MKPGQPARRRGYAIVFAILGVILVVTFSAVLARYAALSIVRERQAALESYVHQAAQSARAWTERHPAALARSASVVLPIAELLPPGASGQLQLQRIESAAGGPIVECRITLQQGRRSLRRRMHWPLPESATTRPASAPARP